MSSRGAMFGTASLPPGWPAMPAGAPWMKKRVLARIGPGAFTTVSSTVRPNSESNEPGPSVALCDQPPASWSRGSWPASCSGSTEG